MISLSISSTLSKKAFHRPAYRSAVPIPLQTVIVLLVEAIHQLSPIIIEEYKYKLCVRLTTLGDNVRNRAIYVCNRSHFSTCKYACLISLLIDF
jgi:hypothetical protein